MASTYALIIGSGWDMLAGEDGGTEVQTAWGVPSAPVHRVCFGDRHVLSIARHG